MPRSASSHTTYIALTEAEYSRQLEQAARRGAEHALREKGLDAADLTTQAALRQGVLTRPDLCRWTGVSDSTVRRWEEAGLPYEQRGRTKFYQVLDIVRWLFQEKNTLASARDAAEVVDTKLQSG